MKDWPRLLLTFPIGIRQGILTSCSLLCMAIHLLTFPDSHNGSLLTIPVGLSAWMFKKRGLFMCFICEVVVLGVYFTIFFGGLRWPTSFVLFTSGGILILLLIGYIITLLRNLVDSADAARLQAQKAEQQTVLAYEQQYQLNQIKNQFVMSVNHELRTPLSALYGYLELSYMVLQQEGLLDRATHGPLLERALSNCEELGLLVNNILDTINLGSEGGPLAVDEISVAEVIADVASRFDAVQQNTHQFLLDIPAQVTVLVNAQCFRHVLRHLLSNAYKYTPANTRVVVSATLTDPNTQQAGPTSQVCICVKDEGPGIPQDELPLLFGQFVRLKRDVGGKVRGNGLGLYITKHLVEAMGGHIWVESKGIEGQGSLFCFTLPAAPHETKFAEQSTISL